MRKLGCLNIPKRARYFAIEAFGALKNTVSINEAKQVFEKICNLFLNESKTKKVQERAHVNAEGAVSGIF